MGKIINYRLALTVIIVLFILILGINHIFAAICGDANLNGNVDISDALLISQYSVGRNPTNFDEGAADANGDSKINIQDALVVSQYYVGIIDKLTCNNIPGPTSKPNPTGELPKHWHESNGFGTNTEGGLGGKVIKVTNLNKNGSGSLREAVETSGPRLIVFEVGGVIDLEDDTLKVSNGQCTIAGQTAPSPGISLIRTNLRVSGNDVVVSHINIMLGDDVDGDPDTANIDGENVVFDHVAIYWSKDENFSMGGPNNVTAYKCIIGEGLQYAGHPDGEHSKGSLITSPNKLSLIGCLYAHNAMRNPRVGSGEILIANQVVYNWTTGWDHRPEWFDFVVSVAGTDVTFVGNVGLQGPESVGEYFLDGHIDKSGDAYMKDNIIIDTAGNDLRVYDPSNIKPLDSPPIWAEGLEVLPAHEALYNVLRTVGPRPGNRDLHNARLVRTVSNGNGEVIDSQNEVGGYPKYSETSQVVNVPSGVEARRDWLDELEDKIAVDTSIDLSRLYNLVGSQESDKLAP